MEKKLNKELDKIAILICCDENYKALVKIENLQKWKKKN